MVLPCGLSVKLLKAFFVSSIAVLIVEGAIQGCGTIPVPCRMGQCKQLIKDFGLHGTFREIRQHVVELVYGSLFVRYCGQFRPQQTALKYGILETQLRGGLKGFIIHAPGVLTCSL